MKKVLSVFASTMMVLSNVFLPVSAEGENPPAEEPVQEEVTEAPETVAEGSETGEENLPDPESTVIQEEEPEAENPDAVPEETQETKEPENNEAESEENLKDEESESLAVTEEETEESEEPDASFALSTTASSDKNAYTFFVWLSENTSQTQAVRDSAAAAARMLTDSLTDADKAKSGKILNDGSFSSAFEPKTYDEIIGYTSTTIGNDGTATSWDSFKYSLDEIVVGNEYRAKENLAPLKVSSVMMAMGEINANYQSSLGTIGHSNTFYSLENLAYKSSGSSGAYPPIKKYDPYTGWYTNEKKVYDYLLAHNLNLKDLTSDQKEQIRKELGLDYASQVQTGHYLTLTDKNGSFKDVTTGFGYIWNQSNDGKYNWTTEKYSQAFGSNTCYAAGADGLTVDEYKALVAQYEQGEEEVTISLNKTEMTLEKGKSETLVATVIPTGTGVTWSSNNTSVATVDSNGKVTAAAAGTATITATTTTGNKTASCTVTVTDPVIAVTGVSLNKTSLTLSKGSSETLTATVSPSNATNKNVTWSSNNTSAATVDSNGKVTAVAAGTAIITVTTKDGNKTASCTVTVTDPETIPVTGIRISPSSLSMKAGDTAQLTVTVEPENATKKGYSLSYTAGAIEAAKDSYDETKIHVTAKSGGTSTITVKTIDGEFTATCSVTVAGDAPVTGVQVSPSTAVIQPGETLKLEATVKPYDARNKKVTWSSADPYIASVDENGVVTGKGIGTIKITATTEEGGFTASCVVSVIYKVTGITLAPSELTLRQGQYGTVQASILPDYATRKSVDWSSSDPSVVTVDSFGSVYAKAPGTAKITATTVDGRFTAECAVTVLAGTAVTSITVEPAGTSYLEVGKSLKLNADVYPENATNKNVVWSSSNPSVAEVSADGTVTAKSIGSADIYAASEENPKMKGNAYISVYIPVTSMQFEKSEYVLDPTESGKCIEPVRTPSNSNEILSYTSSDPTVAEVLNGNGMVVPHKEGTTIITAYNRNKTISASYKLTIKKAVESASFESEHMDAYAGAYMKNDLIVSPASERENVRITSSDENVVKTFAEGKFKAVSAGSATITATHRNGKVLASYTVTVTNMPANVIPVESVALRPGYSYIMVGETAKQEVFERPNNANYHYISYGTENPEVAAIDKDGVITGIAPGKTRIYAESIKNYRTYAEVVVMAPSDVRVTGVTLDQESAEIEKNGSVKLTATVSPANASHKDIYWYSDRPYITIDEDGVVTASANGAGTVFAKTKDGGFVASCEIRIPVRVEKVELNKTALSLEKGKSETLTATITPSDADNQKITWNSDKPEVAAVDKNGKVTAVSKGSAIITVTAEDGGKTASCTVTVTDPPVVHVTGVTLNKTSLSLAKGGSQTLTADVRPANATNKNVIWSSSDLNVASVAEDGTVTAVGAGTADITVTTKDGNKTAVCTVTVADVENGLIITGVEDHYTYTGSSIKPAVRVYYNGVLLTEKTDYTVSYVNNTSAAKEDDPKAPAVVVKGIGNYTKEGRETFTIDPIDMEEVSVEAITLVQASKTSALKPKVTWNGRTLRLGRDYTVDQTELDQTAPGEYNVKLSGKGNFANTRKLTVTVAANDKSVVPVTKLKVTAKAVKYADIEEEADKFNAVINKCGLSVKNGGKTVTAENYEIVKDEHSDDNCTRAGTCTFILEGKGAYYGRKTVSVKISGTAISKAKPNGPVNYDGSEKTVDGNTLKLVVKSGNTKTVLSENTDYVIVSGTYENNINAGKASVTVEGRGAYTGRAKITFTISPDTDAKTVEVSDAVYSKGGAIPRVKVTNHDGTVLQEGRDYKLTLSNKTAGTGKVSVTFLGNYKGSKAAPEYFNIAKKDIREVFVTCVEPVVKKNNKGNYKAKITLTDLDGKKLASSDYTIVEYRRGDEVLNKNSEINETDVITAVIEGKGKNYEGKTQISYSMKNTVLDLSKAVIKVGNKEYTGDPVVIDEGDITVHRIKNGNVTNTLNYGEDYKVLCYENNVKKGTAKVTFIGTGRCSGLKTVSFKIVQRDVTTRISEGAEYFAHAFGF